MERQKKLLHDRGICVVIPTFNNGGTIANVLTRTLKVCQDVIVVNDGSTDDTSTILHSFKDIILLEHPTNRGKGCALKSGFRKAKEMGFAYAITLDGDGQHQPEDITLFLEANRQHPGALIIGERQQTGDGGGARFANRFSNFWFWVQTGRKLKDTQTGYRLYPLKKLLGLSLLTSRYEAELELLVFSSWHGTKIVSIPINVYYPPREERVTHFHPVKDFTRISILNTVLCLLTLVYGLPLRLFHFLMKYIRTWYSLLFFVTFSLFIMTPMVWLYVKIGKMTEKKRYRLHKLIQWMSRFVMIHHGIPGTKFSYQVKDHNVFNKPHVIICNHQSHLDLTALLVFSPHIIFLTNDWVWNNPFYGFLIRHAEYYPVAEGIDQLMPKLQSLVERGYSIAVFPEGTRSKDCKIGRFHQGAFYIANQLGVDVLPMYLYGTGKVLPKRTYTLNKSPIFIEVGEPFCVEKGMWKETASLMRKQYIQKYEDIANRIEQDV